MIDGGEARWLTTPTLVGGSTGVELKPVTTRRLDDQGRYFGEIDKIGSRLQIKILGGFG